MIDLLGIIASSRTSTPITFKQKTTLTVDTSGTSHSTPAFSSTVSTGSTIIVYIWRLDSGVRTVTGVVDSTGANTYVQDGYITNGNNSCDVWRASNVTGGSSFVVTATTSGNDQATIGAVEFSGLVTSAPLDGAGSTAHGSTPGTQPHTGAFSTSNANDLLFCTFENDGGTSVTPPSGFTTLQTAASGGFQPDGSAAYKIVSTTQSSIDPTWSGLGSGANYTAIGLAYKGH